MMNKNEFSDLMDRLKVCSEWKFPERKWTEVMYFEMTAKWTGFENELKSRVLELEEEMYCCTKNHNDAPSEIFIPTIERFDIELPPLDGMLKRLEIKVTKRGEVEHTWLILHGLKRGSNSNSETYIHLGRKILNENG